MGVANGRCFSFCFAGLKFLKEKIQDDLSELKNEKVADR
jgi:hypothetical protein